VISYDPLELCALQRADHADSIGWLCRGNAACLFDRGRSRASRHREQL